MNQNQEFLIEITSPTFEEIDNCMCKLSRQYSIEIKPLQKQYEKLLQTFDVNLWKKVMKNKKNIETKIIDKIINMFPSLKKDNVIAFLHGSYAKNLNEWHSDIDLNILYPVNERANLLPIEELIYVMLYRIFKLSGRDKIHTMMIYLPMQFTEKYIIFSQEYKLLFPDGKKINYKCRENYENIFPKILNSYRDINAFEKYIISSSLLDNNLEWCYSYESLPLNNSDIVYQIIESCDSKIINNISWPQKYISDINEYVEKISEKELFSFKEEISISELNKKIKIENINYIYKMLTLIRRYIIANGNFIKNLDFYTIIASDFMQSHFSKQEIKKIEESIFRYLWFVSRIEYLMEINHFNFSSRENTKIKKQDLFKLYNELYNNLFEEDYRREINSLKQTLLFIVKKIKGEIENENR